MALRGKQLVMSERICLAVALESLQRLGWAEVPAMLLDSISLIQVASGGESYPKSWQYEFLFPFIGHRKVFYKVLVTLRASAAGCWEGGNVLVFHPALETPWLTTFEVAVPDRLELKPFQQECLVSRRLAKAFAEFADMLEGLGYVRPCSNCGARPREGAKFCPVCGQRLA